MTKYSLFPPMSKKNHPSEKNKNSVMSHLNSKFYFEFVCLTRLFIFFACRYYFSTYEDDNLLCILNDEAYSKDEQRINVIPEQYTIDEDLIKNFKQIL
jgi:hypothetical protein